MQSVFEKDMKNVIHYSNFSNKQSKNTLGSQDVVDFINDQIFVKVSVMPLLLES